MEKLTPQKAIDFLTKTPDEFGHLLGFTKLGKLHRKWIIEMVKGQDDKTLQASRGTYKTTCVSLALAIIIIVFPNKRTLFMRKTDTDIKEVIKQVQKILLDQKTQYFVWAIYKQPLILTVQSVTEISTNLTNDIKGTSQLVGMGIGSSITGKHFDDIFTDDIVNINDRTSRAERERTKLVYQELQNIKNRDGRIFNTGTPWRKDDCFSIMPNIVKYDCYNEEVKKIISPEDVEKLKKTMTPSLFAANYELKHVADDDVIFTSPKINGDPQLVKNGIAQCDAAFGGGDYTAYSLSAYHNGKYYVLGKCWQKAVDDVMNKIVEIHNENLGGKLYTEKNADKGYVAKEFRKRGLRTVTYNENQNKYVKICTHLKGVWENIVFVKGTDQEYIDQICDYNENAEHDDCPDSLASLIRVLPARDRTKESSIFL